MTTLDDLLMALEFVSSGGGMENTAYLCRQTGLIYYHSEYGDNEEELPEDVGSDRYVAIPDKRELNLGKPLVLKFAAEFLGDEQRKVREIFSQPGAYARFKDLLEHIGKSQQWYDYEAKAQAEAIRAWCEHNGVQVDG